MACPTLFGGTLVCVLFTVISVRVALNYISGIADEFLTFIGCIFV